MTSTDVEGTAEEIGTDLEPVQAQPPATLFRTDDPLEVVARATAVADALKGVLTRQGLTKKIQNRDHVLVEGWTTLGAMVGVMPVLVWTHPLEGQAAEGKTFGYEARVEARSVDGRVIGAAEAMCTRAESSWRSRDDYALRSMAQTRATSKALRGPLGFIVTLAGYVATPAEEMDSSGDQHVAAATQKMGAQEEPMSPLARQKVIAAFADAGVEDMTPFLAAVGLEDADLMTLAHTVRLRELLDEAKAA